MGKPKMEVRLKRVGVRRLLRSQEMMNVCTKYAFSAQNRLGDGYEVLYRTDKTRVVASVAAVTPAAIQDNAKNNTILKALGGGSG